MSQGADNFNTQDEFISSEDKEKILHSLSDKNISNLFDILKNGVNALMDSKRYKQYLNFCSHLYYYSYNNNLLIAAQKPNATYVGSYSFWKTQKRYVKKGEKGIRIIAPITKKKKQEITVLGIDGKPQYNTNGDILKRNVDVNDVVGYRIVSVFDISQTDGEPVPKLLNLLSGSSKVAENIIESITQISEVPIQYLNIPENGYFNPDSKTIVIKNSLDTNQKAKTLVHEYTHSILHSKIHDYELNRDRYEIEAESTAYIVSKHYGLDTSEYSFGYIAHWADGKKIDEYKQSLNTIKNTADNIITDMDKILEKVNDRELKQEKKDIQKDLLENKIPPNTHLIDGIYLLNCITNKKNTVTEVKQLIKNTNTIENNEIKSCVNSISKSMITKEQAITKTAEYEMER